MHCALSCLFHPLYVLLLERAPPHVPLYNSVTVSFFCLTHAPTVCACARGMYVRNLPSAPFPFLFSLVLLPPLLLFLLLCSHTIELHRIASHITLRSHDYNLLRFITIYSLDFIIKANDLANGTTGGTHPSSALRRDATLGILLVFDLCI